jgi:MFS family permease
MDSPSRPDWRRLLVLYWITSVVEGIGVAQIYAFMSTRLSEVGMSDADIGHVLGLLFSLFFVAGLPLIPLWGVWADKYSRKAVIIRSALVEAVVFVAVAASAAPWQLAVSMVLVGFQLGNSGVMIAAIRDVTPRPRLGLAMGIFASSTPLGFGLGPEVGQVMIGSLHYSSAAVFMVSAGLSVAVALMLALGSAEVRPEIVPTGSTLRLAFGAVRGVFADRTVRWLFAVSAIVFVGRQMALPYLPLVVHATEGSSLRAAGSVGTVLFVSAIFGAVLAPVSGWAADRIGFRRVLVVAVAGSAVSIWFLGAAPTVAWIAVAATLQTAFQAGVGSMVSGLLAVEVPSERRSATLNLIYLPLYFGGVAGPAVASIVYSRGLDAVFGVAAGVLVGATVLAIMFARRTTAPAVEAWTGTDASF